MKYVLKKRPKSPTIIIGFPTIGLVSTIATKSLLDHLDTERIGYLEEPKKMTPLTAIHKADVVEPLSLYYNKKHNIIILQSLTEINKMEWEISDAIQRLATELKAKEIIILEGIPSQKQKINTYFYSNSKKEKNMGSAKPLKEGILMGISAAMLLKSKSPITCVFSETHSSLPDSEAAANIINVLDEYLGLKVDTKPLMKQAKKFEQALKQYLEKHPQSGKKAQKEDTDYLG